MGGEVHKVTQSMKDRCIVMPATFEERQAKRQAEFEAQHEIWILDNSQL